MGLGWLTVAMPEAGDFVESLNHTVASHTALRAFSSVVSQMPGYNSQRGGTARTSQFSLLCIMCAVLCVNV
jgi:hypothetical protein